MVKRIATWLATCWLLTACASAGQTPAPQVVTVYATLSTQPWLAELFVCANAQSVVLRVESEAPQIYLRLGEPTPLTSPAYQVGEEEVLVVANQQTPLQSLSLEETQNLFTGWDSATPQVWVYASDADVQTWFDQAVMKARSVSAVARIAADPQAMTDALQSDPNSIGILPQRWLTSSLRKLYSAGKAPVLALTTAETSDAALDLIACLSK
ncbi:MAG: hypothetical protein IT310_02280 [Anaerolineales bacterium]|nr:hypothetical protein [Anaerolineales bacterium]